MTTDSIGVAVIGAGMAGRAHAAGYRGATGVFDAFGPDVRLVAIADINDELAEDTRRRYGFARTEHDWQAVVEADDIDAVSVVLANHLHREVIEALLAAGKHVLCEKPFAPNVSDASAMVDAATRSGRGRMSANTVGGDYTIEKTDQIPSAREAVRDPGQ